MSPVSTHLYYFYYPKNPWCYLVDDLNAILLDKKKKKKKTWTVIGAALKAKDIETIALNGFSVTFSLFLQQICMFWSDERWPNTNTPVPQYLLSLSTALYNKNVGVNVFHTHPVGKRESGVGPDPVHYSPKLHQEGNQTEPGSNMEPHRGIRYKYFSNNQASNWKERGNCIMSCSISK